MCMMCEAFENSRDREREKELLHDLKWNKKWMMIMKTIVVTLPMTRWAISLYERQSEIKKKDDAEEVIVGVECWTIFERGISIISSFAAMITPLVGWLMEPHFSEFSNWNKMTKSLFVCILTASLLPISFIYHQLSVVKRPCNNEENKHCKGPRWTYIAANQAASNDFIRLNHLAIFYFCVRLLMSSHRYMVNETLLIYTHK